MSSESDIETRVALVERDVSQMASLFKKLDETMDKLVDVSASIKELLAVHEVKLQKTEESTTDIYKLLEINRQDAKRNAEILEEKFEKGFQELKKDICSFSSRVSEIEKWKWKLSGIAAFIAIVFSVLASFLHR